MTDAEELVRRFVAATADQSLQEAGKLVGVSHATVGRWRTGDFKRLYPKTQRAIRDYLTRRDVRQLEDVGGWSSGAAWAIARMQACMETVIREAMARGGVLNPPAEAFEELLPDREDVIQRRE